MTAIRLPHRELLKRTTRFHSLVSQGETISLAELAILAGMGLVAATASLFIEMNLRVPGHAILRVILPLSLGLALVPRKGAGAIMSMTGGLAFVFYSLGAGEGLSFGALTSLIATGPIVEGMLNRSRSGWEFYSRFALAGMLSNLLALIAQTTAKLLKVGGTRPFTSWISVAWLTYLLCGLVAGVVCGLLLFRQAPGETTPQESAS